MISLLIFGIVLLVIAALLLFAPGVLSRASEFLNRKVLSERALLSHRLWLALACLIVGVLLILSYNGYLLPLMMKY